MRNDVAMIQIGVKNVGKERDNSQGRPEPGICFSGGNI